MTLDRITINSEVCGGQPCVRGLRFPVHQIVQLVASGNDTEAIIKDFPYLEAEDIRQALEYAAWLTREEWVAL